MVKLTEQDLIGVWSEDLLLYTTLDHSTLIFQDGIGLIHWSQLEHGTIQTFSWYIKNGLISLKGIAFYWLENDKIVDVNLSKMDLANISVVSDHRTDLYGQEIQSLILSKQIDWCMGKVVGLVEKDINKIPYYKELFSKVGCKYESI